MHPSRGTRPLPWCAVGLLLVWGLTGCYTPGPRGPRSFSLPEGFKYRPATPQEGPAAVAARKRAKQARSAREGARAQAPSASGVDSEPPLSATGTAAPAARIRLAASEVDGDTAAPTVEGALDSYLEFIRYNEERLKRSGRSVEEKQREQRALQELLQWARRQNERLLCAVGVLLPFVSGRTLAGAESLERAALVTGRGLDEVRVLQRVATHLSPTEADQVSVLMHQVSRGGKLSEEDIAFLRRVAAGLEKPLQEAAGTLRRGGKVPLMGSRLGEAGVR